VLNGGTYWWLTEEHINFLYYKWGGFTTPFFFLQ
jgi:hypothetical protein